MKSLLIFFLIFCYSACLALVNINTANFDELRTIKGIGPKKAQQIIDYRTYHGDFLNIYELKNIKGFSYKTINKLRTQVAV